jgi:hypothetical protein
MHTGKKTGGEASWQAVSCQPSARGLGGSGYCPACGREHFYVAGPAYEQALSLMRTLAEKKRIDFLAPAAEADPRFGVDYLFGEARGQMFGVMVCRDLAGTLRVLRAFSCQYNGEWEVEGFVPPLFAVAEFKALTCEVERRLKELGAEIARRAPDSPATGKLRRERKQLSQRLMREIHGLYRLHNFAGEVRSLAEAFIGPGGIPTGAGDCCAPKLLNHAAKNNLTPLGIAEFFWGKENRSATRQHGRFYPACKEKCAPILGFLLCGLAGEGKAW